MSFRRARCAHDWASGTPSTPIELAAVSHAQGQCFCPGAGADTPTTPSRRRTLFAPQPAPGPKPGLSLCATLAVVGSLGCNETPDEVMARQRACATEFASHDGDGDGKMSPAELEAALESLPKRVEEQLWQLDLRKCVGAQVLSTLEGPVIKR